MNKIILFLLILPVLIFSQVNVKINPNVHDWLTLYDGTLGRRDTTKAFDAKGWQGVATMFLDWDSLAAGDDSDSCLTIELELYHGTNDNEVTEQKNDTGIGWAKYYTGTAVNGLIDTVTRSTESAYSVYIDVGADNAFCMGDSGRFIIYQGVGDSSLVRIEFGGQ